MAQRKIAYDGSGLTSATGATHHDDANFGSSNTARGNPTAIQDWVGGSTFLTTSMTYDTTGQVLTQTDPAGNVTQFGYADNFFNDSGNGSNPTGYTAPALTNAYLTSVTLPIIGAKSFGYYYGSGKEAEETDQNSALTAYHFYDQDDRPTATVYPSGFTMGTYPSAGEVDSYDGVADTSPSTSCSSCRHAQIGLDAWGRKTSERLVNNPAGAVEVDTIYDSTQRVSQASHPYVSNPVYETAVYDGFDRQTQVKHPDGQISQTLYGPSVTSGGGLASHQGSAATYGYGYPNFGD